MNKDVENYAASQQNKGRSQLPSRPWEKNAVDRFDLNGTEFMVTVDYY